MTSFDSGEQSRALRTALRAAEAAADISRGYYQGDYSVRIKKDQTPVTQADLECEEKIREIILGEFPDHGFYGEETGRLQDDAECVWLVDPIDGTKGFIRHYPFFSTQIALMERGWITLGVSNAPLMHEVASAERGRGAWLNGQRLQVSNIRELRLATISTGNLRTLAGGSGWKGLGKIVTAVDRIRGYGDFYHYHLLAAGKIEAVIESDVNILDIAALSVIVTEAGGAFTDLNGFEPGLDTTTVLASNALLHQELLAGLRASA